MGSPGSLALNHWVLIGTVIVLIGWSVYEWWKYHHMRRGGDPHRDVLDQKTKAAIVTALAIPVTMVVVYAIATQGPVG